MSRIVVITTAMLILMALPAVAANSPLNMIPGYMQEFSNNAQAAESVLRGMDMEDWSQQEIDDYLFNSMYAIYYSLILYVQEHNEHPDSPEQLMESGSLAVWPGNPFNEWEPITWVPESMEFSAGNLVLQLCQPDKYSCIPPRPITFVMSIYGPTCDYTPLEAEIASPFETMTWATRPAGTVFSCAYYRSPSSK